MLQFLSFVRLVFQINVTSSAAINVNNRHSFCQIYSCLPHTGILRFHSVRIHHKRLSECLPINLLFSNIDADIWNSVNFSNPSEMVKHDHPQVYLLQSIKNGDVGSSSRIKNGQAESSSSVSTSVHQEW